MMSVTLSPDTLNCPEVTRRAHAGIGPYIMVWLPPLSLMVVLLRLCPVALLPAAAAGVVTAPWPMGEQWGAWLMT
jgi:hypothetical protein